MKVTQADVYCPDVWWYGEERVPDIDVGRLPYLPDLVIEVLSPSTRRPDLGTKRLRYEHQGLPELWVIDPSPGAKPVVGVFRRSSPDNPSFDLNLTLRVDDVLGSPQLDGFSVKVRDLVP